VAGPPREKGDTYASEEGSEKGPSKEGCEEGRKEEVVFMPGPERVPALILQVAIGVVWPPLFYCLDVTPPLRPSLRVNEMPGKIRTES